jgi:hypothetical protein
MDGLVAEAEATETELPVTDKPADGSTDESTTEAGDKGGWDAGQATSRPGEATRRHDARRDAESLYDQIHGDMVLGNKFVLTVEGQKWRIRELASDLAEPARHAFVSPTNWAELCQRFDERPTAIVRGPSGHGKDTMAIRLLQWAGTDTIYNLDPLVDLDNLLAVIETNLDELRAAQRRVGFLLCQPRDSSPLRAFALQALERALQDIQAKLVITLRGEDSLRDDSLVPFVLPAAAGPINYAGVVEQHLRWRLKNEHFAAALMSQPELSELVAQTLATRPSCQTGADLALIISQEVSDTGVDVNRVRLRMARNREESFDIWFDGLHDTATRSFAIALAVLNGQSYDEVAQAALALQARLEPQRQVVIDGGARLVTRRVDTFTDPAGPRLTALRATASQGQIRGGQGWVPARTVSYLDTSYVQRVLRFAWSEYQIQHHLLAWLGELMAKPSDPIRTYAAQALGELATESFEYVREHGLSAWAGSDDRLLRQSTAYALKPAAKLPALRDAVQRLVGSWYADHGDPRRQATAAQVHGASLGRDSPQGTIEALGRLASIGEFEVAWAIGDALTDFAVEDPERTLPFVYDGLIAWTTVNGRPAPTSHSSSWPARWYTIRRSTLTEHDHRPGPRCCSCLTMSRCASS